ncbi:hypothetical protein OG548_07290 [Streptomyces sp. NBC_01356]|uniref:hypothetical protein n=1 Tax=Streptomyces sp. NBC_01356 TaxID=2903836 RepID=UPI002E36B105|nr:hypothetical protein [Streptomyces sp. NBC_01356]
MIASYITAEKAYGNTPLPVFMPAKDGRVIADDPAKVSFETLGDYTDVTTGKPVGNVVRHAYADGDDTYTATFTRYRDLSLNELIDSLQGPKRLAVKLVRFDGAHLRFEGELRIEHLRAGSVVGSHTDSAIWEPMYMGRTQ